MSFRFQKRVKVMPGVRLNFSKRGVSTSVGKRGATVSLGRQGLYGNVGIPGSGISYRTKLNKKSRTKTRTNITNPQQESNESIALMFDKKTHSLQFVNQHNEELPSSVVRELNKQYATEIIEIYKEKEIEINEQTTRLLDLHHQIIPERSSEELYRIATTMESFEEEKPNKEEIYREVEQQKKEKFTFLSQLSLLLPARRKAFEDQVHTETEKMYENELSNYYELLAEHQDKMKQQKQIAEKVVQGHISSIEKWLEIHLETVDFPLETNVAFEVLTKETIYLDVDLPEIDEVPLSKATILKSGKLKVNNKSQRELREDYAIMVGGTALYLCSFVFSLIPTCQQVIISGFTQRLNSSTGHIDDVYIYSLDVDRETFYSLNFDHIHPIAAFDNFKPKINVTKTFIFKDIEPYSPKHFS